MAQTARLRQQKRVDFARLFHLRRRQETGRRSIRQ
jgi:hypothetical protein